MTRSPGTGRAARPRRLFRLTLCFWVLLAGNEALTAFVGMAEKFAGAKVMISLTDELSEVGLMVAGQALQMLAFAALLAVLPCLFWAAVCLPCRRVLARTLAPARWRRWVFWFVACASFFNVWYGLHGFVLPGSGLATSWLASLVGAARFPTGGSVWGADRLAPLALAGPVVLAMTVLAFTRSRPLRRATAVAVVVLTTAAAGWSRVRATGAPAPFTAAGNVVLIGLDSLQANRLALGGGDPGLAPNIDGFFAEALRFDNAWTPFARTYPSWMSILTGRFPAHHGLRFNLAPDSQLAPDNDYLPQQLAAAGYNTLHATDECRFSVIRPRFGFQRLLHPTMGAIDFMLGSMFDFSAANLARQTRLGHDLFPAIADNRASLSYNGDLFADDVIAALDELPRDEPAFVVVHLCGNHYPFTTPLPYSRQGADAVESSIAMLDAQVGRLLDWLDASGMSRAGTTVLLSDHGDGWSGDLGDDTNEHGDDLDQVVANKVLLGMRGPTVPKRGSVDALVRTLDLAPTVLELAGLPWDPATIDGRSLLPWLRGDGEGEAPRSLFAESGIGRKVFGLKRLVQEHIDWYQTQAHTGLVFLRPEGVDEFMPYKSYMLLEDGVRLVVTPSLGKFQLAAVDPTTGLDREQAPELSAERRADLLARLVAHNGLDGTALLGAARKRGFLP